MNKFKINSYCNEDGIIFLDDDFDISILTKELYYSKMDVIEENFQKSLDLLTAEDFLYQTYWK